MPFIYLSRLRHFCNSSKLCQKIATHFTWHFVKKIFVRHLNLNLSSRIMPYLHYHNFCTAISESPCASVSKRVHHCNENEFGLYENELMGGTHFQMNGFEQRPRLDRGKWKETQHKKPEGS